MRVVKRDERFVLMRSYYFDRTVDIYKKLKRLGLIESCVWVLMRGKVRVRG
jgi:hypothetical protein